MQLPRVPWHLHPRRHVLNAFGVRLTVEAVVLKHQDRRAFHTPHRRRIHKVPLRIFRTHAPLLRGRITCQLREPIGVVARPTDRVHAVANFEGPQHALPLDRRPQVLRERNDVLTELAQARIPNSQEIDLHVLQGNEHGFVNRRFCEEIAQLLVWEAPTRIHSVLGTSHGHGLGLVLEIVLLHFVFDVKVTYQAPTLIRLRDE